MSQPLRQSRDAALGLEVDAVTVRFGGVVALDRVSLRVRPGEIVGVIGPNGAGKTTLFNAICGFVRPDAGSIRYQGRSLDGVRPHQLASLGIARTLQGLGLWQGLTTLENVMVAGHQAGSGLVAALLGLPRAEREERALRQRAERLLAELGAAELAGKRPAAIPFGMQKRVALARALLAEPTLLLLDEPASGLSAGELEHLRGVLRGLRARGDLGVALVEHHMDLVMSLCDRVVVLELGRVIAEGPPAQVQANPAVTEAYLGQEVTIAGGGGGHA
jgi:branched-chain amino acid transport system ATP-binding protein